MNRYLAFFGYHHPNGGMGDFLSDHSELKDAINAIADADPKNTIESTWGHVYDTVNKEIVYTK